MTKRRETEFWNVIDLIPYPKNAKKHSPEQVKTLATLINKHGWTQPIVIDGDNDPGMIVIGHGRRLAAIELGLEKVSVTVLYGFTREEIDAIRLADNRATSTDYDTPLLREELARLDAIGEDILSLGFTDKELDFMTADLGVFDESLFVEDIAEAVEGQNQKNKESITETDKSATPVGEAFGFKRVTIAQSRVIRNFMKQLESKSGKRGVEALLYFMENCND
jgi:ParB-like chromosome segregation protein Spo0J